MYVYVWYVLGEEKKSIPSIFYSDQLPFPINFIYTFVRESFKFDNTSSDFLQPKTSSSPFLQTGPFVFQLFCKLQGQNKLLIGIQIYLEKGVPTTSVRVQNWERLKVKPDLRCSHVTKNKTKQTTKIYTSKNCNPDVFPALLQSYFQKSTNNEHRQICGYIGLNLEPITKSSITHAFVWGIGKI